MKRATTVTVCLMAVAVLTAIWVLLSHSSGTEPRSSMRTAQVEGPAGHIPRVLLVHSYHSDYEWVAAITRGVQMAIPAVGVDVETFHMDTKRRPAETWKIESGQRAMQVVADWQPDVVIACDDNAQAYFARYLVGLRSPQVVFCGVNGRPADYGYPATNVTGILERPHVAAAVHLLQQMLPTARRLAIVTDDSETSDGAIAEMSSDDCGARVVSVERPETFDQWKSAVAGCQQTADAIAIYMYHTVKRCASDTLSIPPSEVMEWTLQNSRLPVVGFFVFAVDDGALCGVVESGVEHGFKAGRMALELLSGNAASEIPITTALEGQSMINLRAAERLGLATSPALTQNVDILVGQQ